uniref:Uncharacterized protein n=1 Tax=viral metagenome TaxID=1070528 RepID=A0A6M3L971_9ZZZZ
MARCQMCGSPIPDKQKICSMCYGDIGYGSDGYAEKWALEQMRIQQEEEEAKKQQEDE